VAQFIGSINIFEGLVVEEERHYVLIHSKEAGCHLYVSHSASAPVGGHVYVAIRPEKVMISTQKPDISRNYTKGTVLDIGYLGDVSIYMYHVRLA